MSPQDTGRALAVLVAAGVTQAEISRRLGKSAGWVRQMLALVNPELAGIAARLGVPLEDVSTPYYAQRILALAEEETERLAGLLAEGKPLSRELLEQAKNAVEAEMVPVSMPEEESDAADQIDYAEVVSSPVRQGRSVPLDEVEHHQAPVLEGAELGDTHLSEPDSGPGPEQVHPDEPQTEPVESSSESGTRDAGEYEEPYATSVEPTLSICLPVSLWQALLDKAGVDGELTTDSVRVAARYFAGWSVKETVVL